MIITVSVTLKCDYHDHEKFTSQSPVSPNE